MKFLTVNPQLAVNAATIETIEVTGHEVNCQLRVTVAGGKAHFVQGYTSSGAAEVALRELKDRLEAMT
jgi:hypothetical protein